MATEQTLNTSVLSFGNRSEADQRLAVRPIASGINNRPKKSSPAEAFHKDATYIGKSIAARTASRRSMVGSSFSGQFHSRASHSQQAANVGVEIAHRLQLDEASRNLIRAICLSHDLGHPPFSHEGEAVIQKKLADHKIAWDHDRATLETLLNQEIHNYSYLGLPLTHATVEGLAKRYWRYDDHAQHASPYARTSEWLPEALRTHENHKKLNLYNKQWNHTEGQIAASADWIAATVSDIEDIAQMLLASTKSDKRSAIETFIAEIGERLPLIQQAANKVKKQMEKMAGREHLLKKRDIPLGDEGRKLAAEIKQFCEALQEALVQDVVAHTKLSLKVHQGLIHHAEDIRDLSELLIQPSPKVKKGLLALKDYYRDGLYRLTNERFLPVSTIVKQVFEDFESGSHAMPDEWNQIWQAIEESNLSPALKAKEKALLVTRFMTTNLSDQDVVWYFAQHHPSQYKQMSKRSDISPYPVQPTGIDARRYQKSGDSVCSTLTALKNQSRLAIHMWENFQLHNMVDFDLRGLETPPDEIIPKALAGSQPFLSMSLIPPDYGCQSSIRPYEVHRGDIVGNYGYLVDLSQTSGDRALVPRLSERNLATGKSIEDKHFQVYKPSDVPEINRALQAYQSKTDMIKAVCSHDYGATVSECQLDALGKYYSSTSGKSMCDTNVFAHNELLVAASQKHVKAIVVTVYKDPHVSSKIQKDQRAFLQLTGAVMGLQHLQRGMDLPVVYYHVNGEHKGEFTHLAQGEEELLASAKAAIKQLQGDNPAKCAEQFSKKLRNLLGDYRWQKFNDAYSQAIAQITGIDPLIPVADQIQSKAAARGR